MKKHRAFILSLAAGIVLATSAYAQTELTVYTAFEAVDLQRFAEAFNKDHPDIKVNWVRDSTGVMTAKLLAEKNNPKADIVWGIAATSLLILKNEGMLEAYTPKDVDKLDPRFVDKDRPTSWIGLDAYVAAVCFNTVEAEKLGLKPPKSWKDLTKPEYKGHVVMPNPASSGTGFLDVSSWLQMFGEKGGWDYMDALHENIANYTHSGSKPCKMAGAGEVPIGVSFEFPASQVKSAGAPVDIIFPEEGSGWESEAVAIMAGTQNMDAAKTLMDWTLTPNAMTALNKSFAVVALPGIAQPVAHIPADLEKKMIKNDLEWAANNRKAILEEWSKRYDSKSESKG
ncbi:putative 2-aminoethylphosphonate ABC transporter substrate-binding protein [Pseudochrobactrum sp. sp1633]|uniref:putative 2-aminoethylphosphonate ABC transporter substrate-binding protein n=1 Tax=Pseudochrobactrum sp. sp1633 TaxID=3036706 RepID=UPI0025A5790F|nr:putative 2-aminoethylphosphonate ABC transporter substrate-binding protein [Pseudochrobactrum sp. sp1633]MDM8347148.1 putative 2-aminoethylphosphonate ABC transporter substrate-binding protein [Pseudochrobactrum sp. sp1633]HWD13274.1 putative 2-aminoethylphosphonate ABC transporter substrate-binding protein [Pseudochrobactrum sp.]